MRYFLMFFFILGSFSASLLEGELSVELSAFAQIEEPQGSSPGSHGPGSEDHQHVSDCEKESESDDDSFHYIRGLYSAKSLVLLRSHYQNRFYLDWSDENFKRPPRSSRS